MPHTWDRTAGLNDQGGQPERLPGWLWPVIGVAMAVVGLTPWLVTGLRLPLQNLWATETLPEQMPRVLLPFNQYTVVLIIAVLVTGAAAAGLVGRSLRSRRPQSGVPGLIGGVLVVQLAALLQTAYVVHAGLTQRPASTVYVAGLVAVATLSILVGALALTLVAVAPPAGAVVGMSIGALAFGPWLDSLLVPFGSLVSPPIALHLLTVLRWVSPVLVGTAVAWAGLRSVGRIAAAVVGLVLLWVVPALTAGILNAAGSRVLARRPAEMVRYAVEVFGTALTTPALVLPPVLVAVAVATVGIFGRGVLRRRRQLSVEV